MRWALCGVSADEECEVIAEAGVPEDFGAFLAFPEGVRWQGYGCARKSAHAAM